LGTATDVLDDVLSRIPVKAEGPVDVPNAFFGGSAFTLAKLKEGFGESEVVAKAPKPVVAFPALAELVVFANVPKPPIAGFELAKRDVELVLADAPKVPGALKVGPAAGVVAGEVAIDAVPLGVPKALCPNVAGWADANAGAGAVEELEADAPKGELAPLLEKPPKPADEALNPAKPPLAGVAGAAIAAGCPKAVEPKPALELRAD
jgi:hypothetical protein